MHRPLPCPLPGATLHDRFVAALDDDLDLPGALACVREMLRADLPADERRWLVLDADAVLGLDLHRVWDAQPAEHGGGADVPAEISALLAARDAARAARDYARADDLRRELGERGWDVVDGPGRLDAASPLTPERDRRLTGREQYEARPAAHAARRARAARVAAWTRPAARASRRGTMPSDDLGEAASRLPAG